MEAPVFQHKLMLLCSGFQHPELRLFFTRARLFLDRVDLTGWHYGERFRTQIPLAFVQRVEWREASAPEPNVVFHLFDGKEIPLILDDLPRWRHMFEERLGTSAFGASKGQRERMVLDLPLHDLVAYTTSMS